MAANKDIVTIDGPSGVGKSSVSRLVAQRLLYTYLDTGAMYRAVALYFHRLAIAADNEKEIASRLRDIDITLFPAAKSDDDVGVVLDGEDVSLAIRTPQMSMVASAISKLPVVRDYLTEMQRNVARQGGVVAEGRDMGTVVFPDAAYKFFLEADAEERCRRRLRQLRQQGLEEEEENVRKMIEERDRNDSERKVAPLKKADDAESIDTTHLPLDEVVQRITSRVQARKGS